MFLSAVAFFVSVLSAKNTRMILCPTRSRDLRSASWSRRRFRACASCSRDFLFRLGCCDDPSNDDDSSESENVSMTQTLRYFQLYSQREIAARYQKVYVEQLILGLVKINISYVKGKKQNFEILENGRNAI